MWPLSDQPAPDFAAELAEDAHWLADLSESVTVWHGDSASEQLLLCRVAAALQVREVPLWEVACGHGDPRQATGYGVARQPPETLASLHARPANAVRRVALAEQWRAVLARNADIRCWRQGHPCVFHGHSFQFIDDGLVDASGTHWQPLARIMASVMASCEGFFATDYLLYWRARELAVRGLLHLKGGDRDAYSDRQARRAAC